VTSQPSSPHNDGAATSDDEGPPRPSPHRPFGLRRRPSAHGEAAGGGHRSALSLPDMFRPRSTDDDPPAHFVDARSPEGRSPDVVLLPQSPPLGGAMPPGAPPGSLSPEQTGSVSPVQDLGLPVSRGMSPTATTEQEFHVSPAGPAAAPAPAVRIDVRKAMEDRDLLPLEDALEAERAT
jgi:hypothetical protein